MDYYTKEHDRILGLIPSKKKYALSGSEISLITGYSSRKVRRLINDLRNEFPIVAKEADKGGYWLAESKEDIKDFINMQQNRMNGYQRTINAMANHLKADDGLKTWSYGDKKKSANRPKQALQ